MRCSVTQGRVVDSGLPGHLGDALTHWRDFDQLRRLGSLTPTMPSPSKSHGTEGPRIQQSGARPALTQCGPRSQSAHAVDTIIVEIPDTGLAKGIGGVEVDGIGLGAV